MTDGPTYPGWARTIEVDGEPVTYTAHADPAIAALMDELARAAYRHMRTHHP